MKKFLKALDDWFFWNVIHPAFDFLMAHKLAARIVSSIFGTVLGTVLGIWLSWFVVMPLIVQR